MKYPLVLLDLDGTLVDSFEDIRASLHAGLAAIGLAHDGDLMPLVRQGAPLEELYAHVRGPRSTDDSPADAERLIAFAHAYRDHYLPHCLTTTRAFPGVADTLAALRALPGRPVVGVATAKRSETARRVLEGTGLLHLVDVVAGSEGIASKPDPAVLHRAADLAGLPVARAIMVGDTERDVQAARAAGCAAAAVTYGGQTEAQMRVHAPDYLLGEFASLLGVLGVASGAGGGGGVPSGA